MNFIKFFSAESKLTNLRLHTYFIWVGTQFQRWNLGIVSTARRAVSALCRLSVARIRYGLYRLFVARIYAYKSTI